MHSVRRRSEVALSFLEVLVKNRTCLLDCLIACLSAEAKTMWRCWATSFSHPKLS